MKHCTGIIMNRAASSPVTRDPAFPIGSPLWHTIKHGAPGGGGRWVVGAGGKDEEEEEEGISKFVTYIHPCTQ